MKWYKVRKEQNSLENKGKAVKKGDLAGGGAGEKKNDDFSGGPEPFSVIPTDARLYGDFQSRVDDKALISKMENKNFYEITFTNKGELIMPVVIEWTYKDGTKEIEKIPVEIWRTNEKTVTKVFMKEKRGDQHYPGS